jgi:hypothetical protein
MAAEAWVTSIKWSTAKLDRCEWHSRPFQRFNPGGAVVPAAAWIPRRFRFLKGLTRPFLEISMGVPEQILGVAQGGLCML